VSEGECNNGGSMANASCQVGGAMGTWGYQPFNCGTTCSCTLICTYLCP
jgi:hypothetical protein